MPYSDPHTSNGTFFAQVQSNLREWHLQAANWMERWIQKQTKISAKIRAGYALALGIAVGGTLMGLWAGSYYQQRAFQHLKLIDSSVYLLTNIRMTSLKIPLYQQIIALQFPEPQTWEMSQIQFLSTFANIQEYLEDLKTDQKLTQLTGFPQWATEYEHSLIRYIETVNLFLAQVKNLKNTPAGLETARQLSLEFIEHPIIQEFNQTSENLEVWIAALENEKEVAESHFYQAHLIFYLIIGLSLLISLILAALLITYTSRAISQPLAAVTYVAQKVTNDSNFDLQAPVVSQDEVGVLAESFNHLIEKVKTLLEALETEKETQLMQSEKMASLGRMLAGVAHELNNPINFIYGNIAPALDYVNDLFDLVESYQTHIPHPPADVADKMEAIELDFIQEDLPKLLQSMQVGAERARAIVLSLKDFSRLDENTPHLVDIHSCLESTLLILHNRIKQGVKVIRQYENIPEIEGFMGQLYQVFMNMITNALDALDEAGQLASQLQTESANCDLQMSQFYQDFFPTLTITTEQLDEESIMVKISDNGIGMSQDSQAFIFESFFTTKPRGIGTGLGLAISREIIIEKHGGTISCCSEKGQGTEFIIALPIKSIQKQNK